MTLKKPPIRKPERHPEDDLPDDWGRPFWPDNKPDRTKQEPWEGMGLPGYVPEYHQTTAYM